MQAREELQSWNWIVIAVDLFSEFFLFELSMIVTFVSAVYGMSHSPITHVPVSPIEIQEAEKLLSPFHEPQRFESGKKRNRLNL